MYEKLAGVRAHTAGEGVPSDTLRREAHLGLAMRDQPMRARPEVGDEELGARIVLAPIETQRCRNAGLEVNARRPIPAVNDDARLLRAVPEAPRGHGARAKALPRPHHHDGAECERDEKDRDRPVHDRIVAPAACGALVVR